MQEVNFQGVMGNVLNCNIVVNKYASISFAMNIEK